MEKAQVPHHNPRSCSGKKPNRTAGLSYRVISDGSDIVIRTNEIGRWVRRPQWERVQFIERLGQELTPYRTPHRLPGAKGSGTVVPGLDQALQT